MVCATIPASLQTHTPVNTFDPAALTRHAGPPKRRDVKDSRTDWVARRASRFAADHFGASLDEVAAQEFPDRSLSEAVDQVVKRWDRQWKDAEHASEHALKEKQRRVRAKTVAKEQAGPPTAPLKRTPQPRCKPCTCSARAHLCSPQERPMGKPRWECTHWEDGAPLGARHPSAHGRGAPLGARLVHR